QKINSKQQEKTETNVQIKQKKQKEFKIKKMQIKPKIEEIPTNNNDYTQIYQEKQYQNHAQYQSQNKPQPKKQQKNNILTPQLDPTQLAQLLSQIQNPKSDLLNIKNTIQNNIIYQSLLQALVQQNFDLSGQTKMKKQDQKENKNEYFDDEDDENDEDDEDDEFSSEEIEEQQQKDESEISSIQSNNLQKSKSIQEIDQNKINNKIQFKYSSTEKNCAKRWWTPEEDNLLKQLVNQLGAKNWKKIASYFLERSNVQCLHRWQKVLNPSLVKGPWTKEEDEIVTKLVMQQGPKNWSAIAKHLPGRIGNNVEKDGIIILIQILKDRWTEEEDQKLQKHIKNLVINGHLLLNIYPEELIMRQKIIGILLLKEN
ncbi:myb protein, putative, partial [Ichthyophthirius multifiliis]